MTAIILYSKKCCQRSGMRVAKPIAIYKSGLEQAN